MRSEPPAMPEAELENLEIDLLLTALARRYGYDFRNYARASLRRRVRRAVQEEGVRTVSGLQERLLHELDALRRFILILSVHVTSMFRDPEFHLALRKRVMPQLRTYPLIRIWIAGCATGEEVYSLAILLKEEGLYDRARIYATDLSDDLLEQASKGVFPLDRMQIYTRNYLRAGGVKDFSSYYRVARDRVILDPELRRHVVFSQHNLAADASFNEFQLILCRNVMIYFDGTLRERTHQLLHQSLCTLGFLGVGLRESIRFSSIEQDYEVVDTQLRLYRRVR